MGLVVERIDKDSMFLNGTISALKRYGKEQEMIEYLKEHPNADFGEANYARTMMLKEFRQGKAYAEQIKRKINERNYKNNRKI